MSHDPHPPADGLASCCLGGKPKLLRKAHELGHRRGVRPVSRTQYDSEHWPYVEHALLLDYVDIDRLLPLARALHEVYPFRTTVTLTDFGLLSAARINDELGLDGESTRGRGTAAGQVADAPAPGREGHQPGGLRGRPIHPGRPGLRRGTRPPDHRQAGPRVGQPGGLPRPRAGRGGGRRRRVPCARRQGLELEET